MNYFEVYAYLVFFGKEFGKDTNTPLGGTEKSAGLPFNIGVSYHKNLYTLFVVSPQFSVTEHR